MNTPLGNDEPKSAPASGAAPNAISHTAVVCDRSDAAQAADVRAWLARSAVADACWFAPRDLDDVAAGVADGRITAVVFPRLDDLLAALWGGRLPLDRWRRAGVRIELAVAPSVDLPALLEPLGSSWHAHARRQRRRRIVAGLVLSAVALLAAWILLLLAR